jgi:hypothetical protein
MVGGSPWRIKNVSGNTANNIRHLDPVSYSSNAANVPPSQLDSGLMAVNSGSQLFVGTPAGVKQVALYTQKSVSTSLLAYTAGSGSNTLSLAYQLTDGFASEINIVVRETQTGVTGLLFALMLSLRRRQWHGAPLKNFSCI